MINGARRQPCTDSVSKTLTSTATQQQTQRPGATSAPYTLPDTVSGSLHHQSNLVPIPRVIHPLLSTMASATGIPAAPAPKAPVTPIEPLNTDAARIYTHIHPVLILSLYAYKFNDLVADPVPALLSTLLPLAVLQIAFVAVCLPPTDGTSTTQIRKQKSSDKKKAAPSKIEKGINGTIVVRWDALFDVGRKLDTRLTHCTAGVSLPPAHGAGLDAPPDCNACLVRRSCYYASYAYTFGWGTHCGSEYASHGICAWCKR